MYVFSSIINASLSHTCICVCTSFFISTHVSAPLIFLYFSVLMHLYNSSLPLPLNFLFLHHPFFCSTSMLTILLFLYFTFVSLLQSIYLYTSFFFLPVTPLSTFSLSHYSLYLTHLSVPLLILPIPLPHSSLYITSLYFFLSLLQVSLPIHLCISVSSSL